MSAQVPGAKDPRPVLPQLQLDELLGELQSRLSVVMSTRDRVRGLLEAVLTIGSDLDLQTMLRRITAGAVTLVDARYGALGVIGEDGKLAQFLTVGIDDRQAAAIGPLPRGHGILGLLIREPHPLRLDDLSQHKAASGFPANHPPMTSFLGVPVRVREEVFGNLYLTDKRGGGSFDAEDESVVLALAAAAGVAIENARLYEAARRREHWLSATAEVATKLLSGSDREDVLTMIVERARELVGADVAVLAVPRGEQLVVEAAAGANSAPLLGSYLPDLTGPEDGMPFLLGDTSDPLPAGFGKGGQVLVVPVEMAPHPGVLVAVTAADAPDPPSSALPELRAFATQVGVALALAEHRREAERLSVYEDRDRIARDLHDLVIQHLFATGMQLESAVRLVEHPDAAARVRGAVDNLDAVIREIRSTIYSLQSVPNGERDSLRHRLLEVVDSGAEQLGFAPSFRLVGLVDTSVPPELGEHVVAVLREALSNAARHAVARRVDVQIEVDDELRLVVQDDGVGITEGGRRSGLANMADRAATCHGTLLIEAGDEHGTRLTWRVPIR
jgi:signal transduction histidine kinase